MQASNPEELPVAAPGGLLPAALASEPGSLFRTFCQRYGVAGNFLLGLGFLLPPLTTAVGWSVAGPMGMVLGAVAGGKGFFSLFNRLSVFGNLRLREALAQRIGVDPERAEFVGMCLPENNTVQGKLLTMRLETDDNVGFLELRPDSLLLRLEEGLVRIAREAIREVGWQRFVELPYLRWIVLDYYEEGVELRRLLICSRECGSLQEARRRTDGLWTRIADWYTEPVVAELEKTRWETR